MELMAQKDKEVLFLLDPTDELVLMNLAQFNRNKLKSIEGEAAETGSTKDKTKEGTIN